jgi:hypothetical protein
MSIKREEKTTRTSAGLCDALFAELDLLRNGDSDYKRATAVARITSQIIASKKLELETAKICEGGLNVSAVVLDGTGLRIGAANG